MDGTSESHFFSTSDNLAPGELRLPRTVFGRSVFFRFRIRNCSEHEPGGYLFLCPPEDFCAGPTLYRWPDCPAYWSLDPSGGVRLSTENAESLGFPRIHIETEMRGYSWDNSVYEGLRRFHRGKGFDPDGQDVARRLGYPLLELSTEEVAPLAYRDVDSRCNLEDSELCQQMGHYL
ncbi:hypothetical protein C8R45DRAFT_499814 [Mycena sanguinolenta]|nr:hypothetical protein C8R45DRAFT_499814 [Mycena sanguinolenta]